MSDIIEKSAVEFEQIFRQYYKPAILFARQMTPDLDTAQEVVQSVFVRLLENDAYRDIETNIKAYIFTSVRNRALSRLKQKQTHQRIHEALAEQEGYEIFDEQGQQDERWTMLQIEIDALPDQCQKIFKMSRYEHLKNAEIASTLGISKRTVETQISKALRVLRRNLTTK